MSTTAASADVCDYKPSALIGVGSTTAVGGAAAGVGGAGAAGTALGFYTLTHATSGLTMLGSTMAGTSAAGTVGIIGGTGGVIGTVGAIVLAPATMIAAGITAAGIGIYEGACVFTVERVTDHDTLLAIMQNLAENAEPDAFRMTEMEDGRPAIFVRQGDDVNIYAVENLYIADGVLKHSDWFMNTTIGVVSEVQLVEDQD